MSRGLEPAEPEVTELMQIIDQNASRLQRRGQCEALTLTTLRQQEAVEQSLRFTLDLHRELMEHYNARDLEARANPSLGEFIHRHMAMMPPLNWDRPVEPDLPRFDPTAAVPIPGPGGAAKAEEPKAMQHVPQAEQTLLTVLQQGVADAVVSIRELSDRLTEFGEVVSLTMPVLHAHDAQPVDMFSQWFSLMLNHTVPLSIPDRNRPLCRSDNYTQRKTAYMRPVIARHRAVINAISDLFDRLPIDATNRSVEGLAALQRLAIDDIDAHLNELGMVYGLRYTPGSLTEATHLPGLGVPIYQIDINFKPDPSFVNFDHRTPLWRVREQTRLLRGEYNPLPQEILDLLPAEVIESQYPHLASKPGNAGMIAYTQSPVAGQLDRQQVIKAGRYLRQHCPDLTDEQVKQATAVVTASFAAGIHHSRDEKEFERVYRKGPSSCMAYGPNDKGWGKLYVNGEFFHPARVYAHPENDIEIVWLEIGARIGARAVVNTRTKTYPSLYSSDSVAGAGPRLRAYLEGLGYSCDGDALEGQKIRRVSPDCNRNAIICPYIDSGNVGVEVYSDHLIIGGGYEADHATGCLESYNVDNYDWTCDVCDDGYSDDNSCYETNDHGCVCESCISRYYTHAYNPEHDCYTYVDNSEPFYTDRTPHTHERSVWFGDGMGNYVHLSEEHYSDEVADRDYCVMTDDDEYILERDAESLGYFDGNDGEWLRIAEYAVLDDELVKRSEVPDDAERLPLVTDSDYPELPVYQSAQEDESEQDDAA